MLKSIMIFFLSFFFSWSLMAGVIENETLVTQQKSYSFSYVCSKLFQEVPLIEVKDRLTIDCMGKAFNVMNFCLQELKDERDLARAFIDPHKKEVVCQSANRVLIKYACERTKDQFCLDSETGCFLFKEKLARRLDLVHSSFLPQKGKKVLSCYFISRKNLSL